MAVIKRYVLLEPYKRTGVYKRVNKTEGKHLYVGQAHTTGLNFSVDQVIDSINAPSIGQRVMFEVFDLTNHMTKRYEGEVKKVCDDDCSLLMYRQKNTSFNRVLILMPNIFISHIYTRK